MICDMHVHTSWSSDSNTPAWQQIESAIAQGMESICITEHQDYDHPAFPPDYYTFLIGDSDRTEEYFEDLKNLKLEYQNKIEVLIGVELGLQPHLADRLKAYTENFPFDFVIGSIHCFQGKDAEDASLYENVDVTEVCKNYFMEELENVLKIPCFDVVGHMDFILRYAPNAAENFAYQKYGDVLDSLLRAIIQSGRGIEVNTSKTKLRGMTNPDWTIIKRYAELGGEIITFGSDAHTAERIGESFNEVSQMVKSSGINYYAVYRNRRPSFYKI